MIHDLIPQFSFAPSSNQGVGKQEAGAINDLLETVFVFALSA
jgi:hypothetical protein